MRAETLSAAFNALNHRLAITPEQVPYLFVERPHSPVHKMRAQLSISDKPVKLLFVGHRGAGKSSELAYLSTLLDKEFLPVFVPLYEIFRGPAVDHTELIFAVTLRLLKEATTQKLLPGGVVTEAWNRVFEAIYQPLRTYLFGANPIAADKEATITLKVNLMVTELETKVGTEAYTRSQVREKFEGRIAELLQQIEDLARLLHKDLGRRVLLLLEDMDKYDPADIRRLFLEHSRTLTAPYPSIIYSFPVAMRYDDSYRAIEQAFDRAYILPNIAIKHRDGSADKHGQTAMHQILSRRLATGLLNERVVSELIEWSGGHVKTLIQLGQQTILNAIVGGADHPGLDHVRQAREAIRDDYAVMLKQPQLDLLLSLQRNPVKHLTDTTGEKQTLLFNGSLLEYGNTVGPWADVNPIVLELLTRHERPNG